MRAPETAPDSPDVTYLAGEEVGADTFTYRVTDGAGRSRLATVTVDVAAAPGHAGGQAVGEARRAGVARDAADRARGHEARRPAQGRGGDRGVARAAVGRDLPHAPGDQALRQPPQLRDHASSAATTGTITVHVNGKASKVRRNSARVDLRGLPKGGSRSRSPSRSATARSFAPPGRTAPVPRRPRREAGHEVRPDRCGRRLRAGHRHSGRRLRRGRRSLPRRSAGGQGDRRDVVGVRGRRHPRRERGRARRGRTGVGRLQPRRRAPAR